MTTLEHEVQRLAKAVEDLKVAIEKLQSTKLDKPARAQNTSPYDASILWARRVSACKRYQR